MLKDKIVWKLMLFYFTNFTGIIGLSFWLPTIIKSLSDSSTTNLEVGWLSMLPPRNYFYGLEYRPNWQASSTFSSLCTYNHYWFYRIFISRRHVANNCDTFSCRRWTIWVRWLLLCLHYLFLQRRYSTSQKMYLP